MYVGDVLRFGTREMFGYNPVAVSFSEEAPAVAGYRPLSRQSSDASLLSKAEGDSDIEGDKDFGIAIDPAVANGGAPAVAVGGSPAVAGDGATAVTHRDTMPNVSAAPTMHSAVLNDRTDVGNIGWFFGSYGSRATNEGMQAGIDLQIKHGPAQIVGLCECQEATENLLRAPAVAGKDGDEGGLECRHGYEYLTLRGNAEQVSCLQFAPIKLLL
jgi:hypothetical protein